MRLSETNVYHKKNTRNTLTIEQMCKLHELGLAYIAERNDHKESCFGVEELLQILPSCIVDDDKLYSLHIYKNSFNVQCVAYKRDRIFLYSLLLDEIPISENCGHLVDALYNCLLWVNDNYPNELAWYKEQLKHYIESK